MKAKNDSVPTFFYVPNFFYVFLKCWDYVVFAFEILFSKKHKFGHFSMSQTFSMFQKNMKNFGTYTAGQRLDFITDP